MTIQEDENENENENENEDGDEADETIPEIDSNLQEIGHKAAWSLSSAKPGFGIALIRDNNSETYWQSDGAQPHVINIQFQKKVEVQVISVNCNSKLDESYTPAQICIRAGTNYHNLQDIKAFEFKNPQGWTTIWLSNVADKPLRTNFLQILVLSNQQNGKDSRIRQIKVFGPSCPITAAFGLPNFQSTEMSAYRILR